MTTSTVPRPMFLEGLFGVSGDGWSEVHATPVRTERKPSPETSGTVSHLESYYVLGSFFFLLFLRRKLSPFISRMWT